MSQDQVATQDTATVIAKRDAWWALMAMGMDAEDEGNAERAEAFYALANLVCPPAETV